MKVLVEKDITSQRYRVYMKFDEYSYSFYLSQAELDNRGLVYVEQCVMTASKEITRVIFNNAMVTMKEIE